MPNGKKSKTEYFKDFNLANFIADDRCVICGNPKALDNIPEDEPATHYDPPPEYPVVTHVEDYFFIVCANCRGKISMGLCITCSSDLDDPKLSADYVYLDVAQHLAEEIVRLRSELTKWIPKIQHYQKKTSPLVTDKGKKDVKSLFKKKRKTKDE